MVEIRVSRAIEIVFFDAFGTLIYLPKSVGEHYREVGLRHGANLSTEALDRAFRARWKASFPRLNTSDGPRPDDDKGWWRELVGGVLNDVAPDGEWIPSAFEPYFEDLYAHFARPGVWAAFPEVPEVLTTLKANGLRLGIISNFDGRLRKILKGLGLDSYFDPVVISSEVGADKPDPRIFLGALRQASATTSTAVHVGDEPERDWGAEAVGMAVYKLHRPEENLRDLPGWLAAHSAARTGLQHEPT